MTKTIDSFKAILAVGKAFPNQPLPNVDTPTPAQLQQALAPKTREEVLQTIEDLGAMAMYQLLKGDAAAAAQMSTGIIALAWAFGIQLESTTDRWKGSYSQLRVILENYVAKAATIPVGFAQQGGAA